jgi:hypothetical protein
MKGFLERWHQDHQSGDREFAGLDGPDQDRDRAWRANLECGTVG